MAMRIVVTGGAGFGTWVCFAARTPSCCCANAGIATARAAAHTKTVVARVDIGSYLLIPTPNNAARG